MRFAQLTPLCLVVVLAACGEDDPAPVDAVDRCMEDGISGYVQGEINRADGEPVSIAMSASELPYGLISDGELQVQFGDQAIDSLSLPLHLKVVENIDTKSLLDLYANAAEDGPAVLDLLDASNVDSGALRRSSLDPFDCSIAAGNQCLQLAFDSTGEFIITDDDHSVYNAKGGTFTVVEFGTPSRVYLQFDVQLGSNVLKADDTSSGSLKGCINARYSSSAQGIVLK